MEFLVSTKGLVDYPKVLWAEMGKEELWVIYPKRPKAEMGKEGVFFKGLRSCIDSMAANPKNSYLTISCALCTFCLNRVRRFLQPMTQMVADSSSLILLAKCSLLEIVCDLFDVFVPTAVVVETASEGLVKNHPDAALISDLISKGAMTVQNPGRDKFILSQSLHKGEKEAIELAVKRNGALLATDDGKAIKAARFLKVPYVITPKIVTELFRLQKISFKKAHGSVKKLGKIGRYSPEIIADALVSLMEEKDDKTDNNKDT